MAKIEVGIRIKRGPMSEIGTLQDGELFYATDLNKLYVGDSVDGNTNIGYDDTDIKSSISTNTTNITALQTEVNSIKESIGNILHPPIVRVAVVNGKLNLTTDIYQLTTMVNNTTIVLPTVNTYTEIHLLFDAPMEYTMIFPAIKWQKVPQIIGGKTYELIFTYTDKWLGGVITYA